MMVLHRSSRQIEHRRFVRERGEEVVAERGIVVLDRVALAGAERGRRRVIDQEYVVASAANAPARTARPPRLSQPLIKPATAVVMAL